MQLDDENTASSGISFGSPDQGAGKKHDDHHGNHEDGNHGHGEGEGEEGEGPWLLSYADMVTLLMCFFILFFQSEKSTGKYNEQQKILARLKALVTDANQEETNEEEFGPSDTKNAPAPIALDTVFALGHTSPNTIEIVLLTNNMFVPGLADVTPDGRASIEAVAENIKTMSSTSLVEIEGHTDSVPIRRGRFIDNWELSTARANSVLRILEKRGIAASRMRAIGLAHYHPLVPEKDSRGFPILSNQALNRRIVIRLRLKSDQKKNASTTIKKD